MYTYILYLHSILRWLILIFLVVNIIAIATSNAKIKYSKWLLISAHTNLLVGLYQYFAGDWGYSLIKQYGFDAVMKNDTYRFWAVEHISGMIVAVIFITIGHSALKRSNNKKANMFFVLALILIIAVIPWPFREAVGRPLFPGMSM